MTQRIRQYDVTEMSEFPGKGGQRRTYDRRKKRIDPEGQQKRYFGHSKKNRFCFPKL